MIWRCCPTGCARTSTPRAGGCSPSAWCSRSHRPPAANGPTTRCRPPRRPAGAFRDALLAQPAVAAQLDAAALDELLDPAGYLGATGALIARALTRFDRELGA